MLYILFVIVLSSVSEFSVGNNVINMIDGEDFIYFVELMLYLGILIIDK